MSDREGGIVKQTSREFVSWEQGIWCGVVVRLGRGGGRRGGGGRGGGGREGHRRRGGERLGFGGSREGKLKKMMTPLSVLHLICTH